MLFFLLDKSSNLLIAVYLICVAVNLLLAVTIIFYMEGNM